MAYMVCMYGLVLFVQLCMVTHGILEVYEGSEPASNTSPFFTVQLQQGALSAFPHVYYSAVNNKYVADHRFYDQTISWIEFGQQSTDEITVIICLNAAQKGTFNDPPPFILPYQYNIDPSKSIKSVNQSCISLYLDSSIGNKKHLSLEYSSTKTTSFMDAFYIFIGDLDPAYNTTDPHTVYFGAGAHNVVSSSSAKNNILQTGDNIHTIYIARGAWVYGKIQVSGSNVNAIVNIIGHGILDGSYFNYANRGNNHIDGASMIDFSNLANAKSVHLVGLTAHNPSSYTINSLSPHSSADQYRCIAWYYQNDGIGLASNSMLTNSFIRTNDDSTKSWVGGQQIRMQNVVISQMYNGAAFQLGWNGVGCVDCYISDSSVIHAYWYDKWDQNSVIDLNYAWNSGQKKTAEWKNVLFENIYIDTPVGRMFSINLDNKVSGASTTVNNITVNNFISRTDLAWFDNPNLAVFQMIQIENVNHGTNYVHGVHFNNVQVAGKKIVNDGGWNMCYFGDTADIQSVSYS